MRFAFLRRTIPWSMVAARVLLGPLTVLGQAARWNGLALAALVLAGLLSDIYDGVLARKWKTDTDALRLADSMADIVFYLGTAWALAHRCPVLWHAHRLLILAMVGMEIERLALDMLRFGKPSSYHAYLSKAAGLMLSVAVIAGFACAGRGSATEGLSSGLLLTALVAGLLSQAEGQGMSMILPAWRRDVGSIFDALRLRRNLLLQAKRAYQAAHRHTAAVHQDGVASLLTEHPMV